MSDILGNLTGWLAELPDFAQAAAGLAALVLAGALVHVLIKRRLIGVLQRLAGRTVQQWDDIILEHGVFGRLAQAVPALIVYFGVAWLPGLGESLAEIVANVALAFVALAMTLALGALLSAGNAIYGTYPVARDRPIKGFVQVAQIVVYVLGAVFIVSALVARSPIVLLTGFGAMTAILLLIFRDTILSLVASIQLTGLDMVRVGDWIEMPQYNADGDVVDLALHTIKVQNWDKTITTIPTHKLISESFKNWRGMSESGGRRIKRSIHIDARSVRFLTDAEVEKFTRFALLREYIERKRSELAAYNAGLGGGGNGQCEPSPADQSRHIQSLLVELSAKSPTDPPRNDAAGTAAPGGREGHSDRDLLLYRHHRMGCLRRHSSGYLRPYPGAMRGVRVAGLSDAHRSGYRGFGSFRSQLIQRTGQYPGRVWRSFWPPRLLPRRCRSLRARVVSECAAN